MRKPLGRCSRVIQIPADSGFGTIDELILYVLRILGPEETECIGGYKPT